MYGTRAARRFRAALIALIGVLVMSVGAASAYAGGRDHGKGLGRQNSVSSQSGEIQQSVQVQSESSNDQSTSDDSSNDHGNNCKKNENSTGEKTGEKRAGRCIEHAIFHHGASALRGK